MQKIILPLIPRSKKNHSQIIMIKGRPRLIPSKQYNQYLKDCGEYLKNVEPFLEPCNVKCLFYMPTHRRVDLCNLLAAICDILVHYGINIDDNSNIVVSHDGSRVLYDHDNPRTEITLTGVEDERSIGMVEKI